MSNFDWGKPKFNEATTYGKMIDAEERHQRMITDEDAYNAYLNNIKTGVFNKVIEMCQESVRLGITFAVSDAIAVIKMKHRDFFYADTPRWNSVGNALVGQLLKDRYPGAMMKLNLNPKGFKLLLEANPEMFQGARMRLQEAADKKKQEENDGDLHHDGQSV